MRVQLAMSAATPPVARVAPRALRALAVAAGRPLRTPASACRPLWPRRRVTLNTSGSVWLPQAAAERIQAERKQNAAREPHGRVLRVGFACPSAPFRPELEAVLSRTNTSLARLELIGVERFEGVSADGVEGERAQPVVPGARRYIWATQSLLPQARG